MKTSLLSLLAVCLAVSPMAHAASFSNPAAISLNEPAAPLPPTAGSPYPSTILVSGESGTISKVVVRLHNINHNRADDMDILLVGPTGAKFVILSDAGGTAVPVVNATVTFDDTAATQIPDLGPLGSGTFRPSAYIPSPDVFPAPAPSGPHNSAAPEGFATFASVFNGIDPNGTWSLYVVDDIANGGQIANIAGGWDLEITTVEDFPTMTTLTSTPNPSFTTAPDNVVTFTATVTSGVFTIDFGTVTFTEGATVLQAATPVDGNGQAQFVTSTLSAGTHVIVAHYDGVPGFANVSSGSTVQDVDYHTVVSGNTFCNPGSIDFPDSGSPGVAKNLYPSHMFVSGVAGSIASLNLKLNGINHPRPDDMDFLLVAPNGATFVAMSDSGGTLPAVNVNLILADSAATALPDLAPLVSGTFRPSSYLPVNDVFPAPAPVGPYNFAAPDGTATFTSVFGGASANGTWSLFVVDDVANGGQIANIANGWCLEFVLNQPPTITCPANITAANDAGQCSASVAFTPTATGTPAPTVQCKIGATTITSPHVFPVGTTTVDCTAQNTGGSATCSFTVTVNDTQAPTISCPANISVGNAPGTCSATVSFTVGASDNCPGVTVVANPASGSSFPVGTTTVNATATDASGNTAMCSFTVTVTDTQNPTISCPANITVNNDPGQCSAVVNFTVSAADNCPGVTVVSSPASGSAFPVGTTTVNSTATDAAGRTATCSFTVTVNDTQNPVITCPANIVQPAAAGQCSATVNFNVTAADNCPGVTVVSSPASGSVFPVGTTTVMATATDAAGHTATCSFTVTVNDTQPPTISCPANISVGNAPGTCSATVSFTVGASDNCPGVTVVATPASGSSFPVGTTTVNATATDASGNTAMCSFTVTVTDTQNPTISCPANITVNNDPGQCSAVVNFTVSAADNCPGVTVVSSPASGSAFPVGTTTVNSTATDATGRTATCSFTVTVNDTQNPVITCPANIVQTTAPGVCSAIVNFNVTATDNCSGAGVTVVSTPASGSVFPVGTTTVMATATDAAGNTATCSFTVTVVNPAPVVAITGPPSGSVFAVGTAITFTGTFTDNIGDVHTAEWTFTSGAQTFTQVGLVNETTGTVTATHTFNAAGVFLVTLKVTDACGNVTISTMIGDLTAMVVIYDPNGGFVTGGGWINSPAGAYVPNPALIGKASFGFVSKYQNGASVPTGNTEFQFHAASFNFSSTAYQWLVIAGAKAQYKGTGTVNGSGNYGFLLKATDGQINGGGGTDKFRIKIWDKNNNDAVVYDNQINDGEQADPTTTLGGGSIVIHH
jgi:hypothetical protein